MKKIFCDNKVFCKKIRENKSCTGCALETIGKVCMLSSPKYTKAFGDETCNDKYFFAICEDFVIMNKHKRKMQDKLGAIIDIKFSFLGNVYDRMVFIHDGKITFNENNMPKEVALKLTEEVKKSILKVKLVKNKKIDQQCLDDMDDEIIHIIRNHIELKRSIRNADNKIISLCKLKYMLSSVYEMTSYLDYLERMLRKDNVLKEENENEQSVFL